MQEAVYTVPGMSCEHCQATLEAEVARVAGVVSVEARLESKLVVVRGEALDDASLRAAIDEAGYEVA